MLNKGFLISILFSQMSQTNAITNVEYCSRKKQLILGET